MTAIYIHIPFCEHICYYCDFNKVFLEGQPVDEYIDLLIFEMETSTSDKNLEPVKTIFVGGGTPTTLTAFQLEKLCLAIHRIFPLTKDIEFSFEANPGDLTVEKLKILKEQGVNRLSMGVQSFNNCLLKKIGRTHTAEDVYNSLYVAKKLGFENISIDLIFSLPGQSESDFKETLTKALALDLPHYSAYSLIIEPKTIFYNLMQKGELLLPSQEVEANMYDVLMDTMEAHGKKQYEISNFARPGFESRHNHVYWNNEHYFGFGAGAHGYLAGTRYSNFGPLKQYMMPLKEGRLPIFQAKKLTIKEQMEEEMFLGLRKVSGVNKQHFFSKFGYQLDNYFYQAIQTTSEKGLLVNAKESVYLSRKGRFLGNQVFQAFL